MLYKGGEGGGAACVHVRNVFLSYQTVKISVQCDCIVYPLARVPVMVWCYEHMAKVSVILCEHMARVPVIFWEHMARVPVMMWVMSLATRGKNRPFHSSRLQ